LKTGDETQRKWQDYWPFLIAAIFGILNVDGVVIPSLSSRYFSILGFQIFDLTSVIPELSLLGIFLITIVISIPGNLFWYWFWGWLGKFIFELTKKQKSVQEGIELGKEIELAIQPLLKRRGFIGRINDYLTETFKWATDENNKFLKRLKKGGYASVFLMAASPEPGGRVAATIFSRTFNSKKGLVSLILGDTLKNAYMVFGFWNLVLRLPSFYIKSVLILILVYFIGAAIYHKLKKRPA